MALFLGHLDSGGGNLGLMSALGFVMGVSVIALAPPLGLWIDRTKRITSTITCLLVQNVTVALACGVVLAHYATTQANPTVLKQQ